MVLSQWIRSEWRTLLLVAFGVLLQLLLVFRPIDVLIVNTLPDDAFYYFEVARNIALGAGSTFDGLNPTNGYHPLWMVVLIGIFSLVGDRGPIYAALFLQIALNAATALLVSRILTRFTESRNLRALGLFIWLFNPFLLYETVNGLETSLSLFLFSLFFLLALRLEEGKSSNHLLLGSVAGLMILARLDLALYLAAYLLWVFVRRRSVDGFRRVFAMGIAASLFVFPWFLWNQVNFGTPMTSSSIAATLVNHQLIVQDHGMSWFQTGKAVVYNTQYELDKLFERTGMYAIACAFFGVAAALGVLGFMQIPSRIALLTVTQVLAVGFAALFFGNAGLRWTARSWYFVSFNLFLAILSVSALDVLFARMYETRWKWAAGAALACAVVFSFGVDWSKNQRRGSMPQHSMMYNATLWMNDNLPKGSVIGVFNAGIQGYFSAHTLINLDGTVNNNALEALHRRELWTYVKSSHIQYVSDFPLYLKYRYKSFLDTEDVFKELVLIKRFGDTQEGLSIWRVK